MDVVHVLIGENFIQAMFEKNKTKLNGSFSIHNNQNKERTIMIFFKIFTRNILLY